MNRVKKPVVEWFTNEVNLVKRTVFHVGMVLLALVLAILLTWMFSFTLRIGWLSWVGLSLYLLAPVAVLIASIVRFRRRRTALFLTFGISLFAAMVLSLILLMAAIAVALHHFT